MNIMILFGGASFEHEVSIITGCLVNKLLKDEYKIFPVYVDKDNNLFYCKDCTIENFRTNKNNKKVEFVKNGFKSSFNKYKMDVAIIATHGFNGEDGMSKAILDFYDIPSVGSSLISSAVNMDKYYSYCILKENGINVVNSAFITKDNLIHNMNYPLILKPATLGSSIGISVVYNEEEYFSKVEECLKYDSKILIQDYLEDIEELNISLYRNKLGLVVSNIEVVDKHETIYSYDDKYTTLSKRNYLDDLDLEIEIQNIATKAYNLFDLSGIVRIDFIRHNNEIFLNEINTIPGSLSYYLYNEEFSEVVKQLVSKVLFDKMHKDCFIFDSNIIFYDYNMKK